jgi:hypothetical protein
MREMKDSGIDWINNTPATWEIKRIKAVLVERNESNNPVKTDFILSLTNDRGVIPYADKGEIGNKSKADLSGYKLAYPNDIVLNSMNVFIGSVALSSYYGCVSPVYYMLYTRYKKDNIKYYNYLFQTQELQKKLHGYGNGIMDIRMRIQMSKLNTVMIPIPPSDEQHKIADYLDKKCSKIDAIIEKQQTVIEKLKAYKLSVITEVVTKGLNPDTEMKDSEIDWIGIIPVHWSLCKLKYVTEIMRGKFNHRPRNDPKYYDGKYPFVQTGDVARASKFIETYSQTLNELGYSVSKEFPKGSICMTIAANVGDVAVLNFDACFPDSVVGFVPVEEIHWNYLYYVLSAMKQQFTRNAIISTQLNLNVEIIKEEFIPIVAYQEQLDIAQYLDNKCSAIENSILRKKDIIEKLTAYKKSLIFEVVTGKKEV